VVSRHQVFFVPNPIDDTGYDMYLCLHQQRHGAPTMEDEVNRTQLARRAFNRAADRIAAERPHDALAKFQRLRRAYERRRELIEFQDWLTVRGYPEIAARMTPAEVL